MNDVENNQNKVHIKKVYMDKTGTLLKIGYCNLICLVLQFSIKKVVYYGICNK